MNKRVNTLVVFCILYLCGVSVDAQHVWKRSYGDFRASTFAMTLEEKFVMVGDYYDSMIIYCNIMQTDSDGFTEWDTLFWYDHWPEWPWCIEPTADSGYIIAQVGGEGGCYVMKFDKKNTLEWDSQIVNDTVEGLRFISSIIQSEDGGYVAVGSAYNYQIGDRAYVLKIDSQGNYLWDRSYAGFGWDIENGFDFGYYFLCEYNGTELLRLDDSGAKLWSTQYNTTSYTPLSLIRTHDGCFIFSSKYNGISFTKVEQDGVILWDKSYDLGFCYNTSIWETFDNGIITTNHREVGLDDDYTILLKMDDQGDSLWSISPEPKLNPSRIVQSSDSLYVFHANNHYEVAYLYKTDSIGDIITGVREIIDASDIPMKCYPNPFTTSTTIEYELIKVCSIQLTVYSSIGNVVYQIEEQKMAQGKHAITLSLHHLPAGLYYAVLGSEEGVSVVKMIKQL